MIAPLVAIEKRTIINEKINIFRRKDIFFIDI
ncbi:hypothetical protein BFZC1_05173 [Lysinibacillus fusiformis ZC1]|nr:hypothetical protein BFZC1_05173 [Lysinibacillus fusiformis ZC1]